MGLLYEIISSAPPRVSQNETPFSFTIDTRNVEVGSTSILSSVYQNDLFANRRTSHT